MYGGPVTAAMPKGMIPPGHMVADHLRAPSPLQWQQQCSAPGSTGFGNWDISEDALAVSGEDDRKEEGAETERFPESSTSPETSDGEEQSLTCDHRLLV